MKNLLVVIMLTLCAFANAEVCLEGRSTTENNVGTINNQEICYVNVKNNSEATISKGFLVVLEPGEGTSYEVEATTTAGRMPHCVAREEAEDGSWFQCVTYGFVDFLYFDNENGNASAGDEIFLSENTAGYVEAESSPGAGDHAAGTFLEAVTATSSSGGVSGFIRLR